MHVCCIYVNITGHFYDEFYTKKFTYINIPLEVSYILSSLKYKNYSTDLLMYDRYNRGKNFILNIKKIPDVFIISVYTNTEYNIVKKELFPLLKNCFKNTKILVDGPAVTLMADNYLYENRIEEMKNVDAFCIGDGEKAIIDYIKQLEQNNFVKTDNLIIKNNDLYLKYDNIYNIENIDDIPYPDIDSWRKYCLPDKNLKLHISLSRGCFNSCIFCSNQILKNKSKGKYYRVRSPKSLIKEIDYFYKKYTNLKFIYLQAESGIPNLSYFVDLCNVLGEYNNKIGNKIKFATQFNFMPSFNDDSVNLVSLIKKANFDFVVFSIESGSFEMRNKLNKPYYTNEQLIIFCKRLNEYQVKSKIRIMYCYPFETKQTYKETVDLLRQCKPTILEVSFLRPKPGTKLYNFYKENSITEPSLYDIFKWITLKWRIYVSYKPLKEIIKFLFESYSSYFIFFRIKCSVDIYINERNKDKFNKAKKYFDMGEYKKAIKYFSKVKIKEDNYWIYGDMAIAKMNIGDYKGALQDFDTVIKLYPKDIYKQKRQECLKLLNKN